MKSAVVGAMKRPLRRLVEGFAASRQGRRLPARIVRYMAWTGTGTDECLRQQCLPVQVHFYQPIPDIEDLEERGIWSRRSRLSGLDFRPEEQVSFLRKRGSRFGSECDWPTGATADPMQYYTENNSFSYACAAALHCVVREFRPARVIEVGSGHSSLVINGALCRNRAEDARKKHEYTIIDPYPDRDKISKLAEVSSIVQERVECVDPGLFGCLRENDVLFVDSGHTVRTGGDVNFLILDVLPAIAPGVIVHFHDIPLPYEYPKVYATNPSFRVFWTEAYLLQAFLCHNSEFEVLLALGFLQTNRSKEFRAAFPLYDPGKHKATSGSLWIRRKTAGRGAPGERCEGAHQAAKRHVPPVPNDRGDSQQ